MKEIKNYLISPWTTLLKNRRLIIELCKLELSERYKGSIIGIAWTFLYPLLMLSVYSLVFIKIFKVKWSGEIGSSDVGIAMIIFAGMIVGNLFAESLSNSSSILRNNVSYIKKIIFPLEVLPVVAVLVACVQATASILVLIFALCFYGVYPSLYLVLVPLVIFIYVMLLMGLAQIVAAIGVYIPDISQTINILAVTLTLLAPEFCPLSLVPERYVWLIKLNPLTLIMEWLRDLIIRQHFISSVEFIIYALVSVLVFYGDLLCIED